MKHIIFSDVDGTLSTDGVHIADEIREDIRWIQDRGIEFIIATGNPFFKSMKDMGHSLNCHYIITSNGAGIINLKEDEYIYKAKLKKEDCQKMLDKAKSLGLGSDWWDEYKLYFNTHVIDEIVEFWRRRDGFEVKIIDQIEHDPFKIEFYDHAGKSDRIDIMIEFFKDFNVQVAHMTPNHVEVTAPDVSKGHAIEWLTEYLKVPLKNTMGIGDSANDETMFKVVSDSYAMDNAPENIKKLAKHQAGHVKENGVGKALRDYVKRNGL